jgi:hypothetical protein
MTRWDKDEMDATIINYVEEHGSLSKAELVDPGTKLPSYDTVRQRYGGLIECSEKLDLNVSVGQRSYSREDLVEIIQEESNGGKVPAVDDLSVSSGSLQREFRNYLNAVWTAGKEPENGWKNSEGDFSEEITADYLHITRENYWYNDPQDKWNTDPIGEAKYLNPTSEELKLGNSNKAVVEEVEMPWVRVNHGYGEDITIQNQEEIMNIVEESDTYLDIIESIEDSKVTEGMVKKIRSRKREWVWKVDVSGRRRSASNS